MESVVDDDHGPWGVGACGKVILANQVHPLAHQVRAILYKVDNGQEGEWHPAPPTGEKYNTSCPNPAVQQAG